MTEASFAVIAVALLALMGTGLYLCLEQAGYWWRSRREMRDFEDELRGLS